MRKFYGLFVGQNATTGTPNPITGKLSIYGDVLRFDSAETRQHYIDTHRFNINEQVIVPGGRQKMRSFCLGWSTRVFDDHLNWLETITMQDLET